MLTASPHDGPISELMPDWRALHARQRGATPFLSAEWAEAWWPHYGADARPFIWRVADGGRTVGLVPLVIRRRGPARVVEPVGMEPGDYWDFLAEPELRPAVAEAFAAAIAAAGASWDAWILRCLVPGSPLVAALDAAGLTAVVRPPILAPAIELPDSFDAYLATLRPSRRSDLRADLRRLDRGEVTLHPVTDPAELPGAIDRWREIRRKQWADSGREINPEHLSPRFSGFLLDAMRAMVPNGSGLVWEFRVDDEFAGSFLGFADDEVFHPYLGGFDPAFARLGIGKIATLIGIRSSIEAGRRRYDFARGAEPYKYVFGAVDRPLAARVIGHPGARSRLALAGARAVLSRRR